jgi:hypothetical protein
MYTMNLGAAGGTVYSSSMDCMTRFKAGEFGATTSTIAKAAYSNCLRTTPRVLNTAMGPAAIASRQAQIPSAGGYVPDCAGSYNPCTEVDKAAAAGKAVSSSLQAKCAAYQTACSQPDAGTGDRYQSEEITADTYVDPTTGETIDANTGLPVVEPWYMNKTYWLIGGAVLVGAAVLLRK